MRRLVLLGAYRRLAVCPTRRRTPGAQHPGFWRSIAEGIAEAGALQQIWPVLLLNFGIGVFYVGTVHGGACRSLCATSITVAPPEIAYVKFLVFWAGTIVAAFAFAGLARNLPIRGAGPSRRGRRPRSAAI